MTVKEPEAAVEVEMPEVVMLRSELEKERQKVAELERQLAAVGPAAATAGGTSPAPNSENTNSTLAAEVITLRQRCIFLENEVYSLKQQSIEMFSRTEAEEECIINRMMKRLMELKKEKETLAMEVEREEELLTNTLQKKLDQLRREKVDLENQLEFEQEYLVNKLSKELNQVKAEKEALAMEVEREEELLTNTLQKKLDQLRKEKEDLEAKLHYEQEHVIARLQTQVQSLKVEKEELENRLHKDSNVLVQSLKEAVEAIKDRRSSPVFQQKELQLLLEISKRVDELYHLNQQPAGPAASSSTTTPHSHSA